MGVGDVFDTGLGFIQSGAEDVVGVCGQTGEEVEEVVVFLGYVEILGDSEDVGKGHSVHDVDDGVVLENM